MDNYISQIKKVLTTRGFLCEAGLYANELSLKTSGISAEF